MLVYWKVPGDGVEYIYFSCYICFPFREYLILDSTFIFLKTADLEYSFLKEKDLNL
jgi:hypothetical protein